MPIPRHSTALPSVQLAALDTTEGVTELRVHGVGGTPPDATLGDLVPEQVMGDAIAGFYRTSDHHADAADKTGGLDADRHVEVYSWGGLTSRSKVRVLWLALLPFLFANLAGWMCPAGTRASAWKFRLHRLAAGLGGLALTVNAILIAAVISADVIGYQTERAGIALHQWWLAPLGWKFIAGHPARQVMLGVLVPALFVLALTWLASTTWRYEAVRPPYQVSATRKNKARMATAAALPGGLADDEFWDGDRSVRLITWIHVAVTGGFLAVVLGVTVRAMAAGSPHEALLGWLAIGLGGATMALGAGYVALDALTTPPMDPAAPDGADADALGDRLRVVMPYLRYAAALALVLACLFAWFQPAAGFGRLAGLPGMADVAGWTALAIAAALVLGLISMLLGLAGERGIFKGAPWVTLMLGFGTLNIVLLNGGIWVAHLVSPVTSDAAAAVAKGQVYLPYLVTSGAPLVAWAVVLALVAFALVELGRYLFSGGLPDAAATQYRAQAKEFREAQTGPRRYWYWSGLDPFAPPAVTDDDHGGSEAWEKKLARVQFLARAPHDAAWLLWAIVAGQVIMALCVWRLHVQPPVIIRNIGVALTGLALPAIMGFLYAAWNDPSRRRTIGILWDVGTFWPRSYHPLCPPCYAERAVPDLQRRMWWLHDNGGRVMLTAHSQGTVLAAAALVQPGCRPEDDQPALITFGSPLIKLYGWGFPAYFGPGLLGPLAPDGSARVSDWHNFHYPTDPIGGPTVGEPTDIGLLDPAECYYVYGQAAPSAQGHSGYWADPRVWAVINSVAAGLTTVPAAGDAEGPVSHDLLLPSGGGRRLSADEGDDGGGRQRVQVLAEVLEREAPPPQGPPPPSRGGRWPGSGGGKDPDGGGRRGQSLQVLMDGMFPHSGRGTLADVGPASARVARALTERDYRQSYMDALFWWLFTSSDAYQDAVRDLGASRKARPVVVLHADGTRSDLLLLDPRRRGGQAAAQLEGSKRAIRLASSFLPRQSLNLVLHRSGLDRSLEAQTVVESAQELAASAWFGLGTVKAPREVPTALSPISRPGLALSSAVPIRSAKDIQVATLGGFLADAGAASAGTCLATTANHALARRWRTYTIGGAAVNVVRRHKASDSCLIRVDKSILDGRTTRGVKGPLADPPSPSPGYFCGATPTDRKTTIIRAYDPAVMFPEPGLLCRVYTDADTSEGDSGVALIDQNDYIVGFAMGMTGFGSLVQYSYWVWAQQVYLAHRLSADMTLGV